MIVYLHGFNSAPSSHKARTTAAWLAARGWSGHFRCPALPHHPEAAVRVIEAELAGGEPGSITLLGSSLGGYYATWFAERYGCRAVLVQPAVRPHIGLRACLGPQQNLYTGARYELTEAHLDGWARLWVESIDPERYLLLLETGDEVLDYRQALARYEGARTVLRQGGDHALQSFAGHLPRIAAFAGLV